MFAQVKCQFLILRLILSAIDTENKYATWHTIVCSHLLKAAAQKYPTYNRNVIVSASRQTGKHTKPI